VFDSPLGTLERSPLALGGLNVDLRPVVWRLTPIRKSPPSCRQFLATPENCSRCHFTLTSDPTATGFFRRKQAPELDVFSKVA
jgi:hypothetical protein